MPSSLGQTMNPRSDSADEHHLLTRGELTVLGRIRSASNATFLCEAALGDDPEAPTLHCVCLLYTSDAADD